MAQLSVSWKDHSKELSTVCKTLLENKFLLDCTIAAAGKSLKAHRLILSACSPYFQMLFGEESEKHPIVILKDVSFDMLKAVIDFIYHGETEISEGHLDAFLALAASLQIKGLDDSSKKNEKLDSSGAAGVFPHCSSSDSKVVPEVQCLSANNEKLHDNFALPHHNYQSDVFPDTHSNSVLFGGCSDTYRVGEKSSPHHRYPRVAHSNSVSFGRCSDTFEMETKSSVIELPHQQTSSLPDQSFLDAEQSAELEPMHEVLLVPKHEEIDEVESVELAQDTLEEDSNTMDEGMAPGFEEENLEQFSDIAACSKSADMPGAFTIPQTMESSNAQGAVTAAMEVSRRPALCGRTGLQQTAWRCPHCFETFSTSWRLQKHVRIHTGERPFKCGVCGVSFHQRCNLTTHMRTHSGERPYRCDVCGASFTQSCNLKKHMLTHSGERPYRCGVCDASFTQNIHLKKHTRTHSGEQPYRCNVCDASFTQISNLKTHTRTHSGERPYRCGVCDACFTQNSHLKKHTRTHSRELPERRDVCSASFTPSGNPKTHRGTHS